jgi:hypothetical protein
MEPGIPRIRSAVVSEGPYTTEPSHKLTEERARRRDATRRTKGSSSGEQLGANEKLEESVAVNDAPRALRLMSVIKKTLTGSASVAGPRIWPRKHH